MLHVNPLGFTFSSMLHSVLSLRTCWNASSAEVKGCGESCLEAEFYHLCFSLVLNWSSSYFLLVWVSWISEIIEAFDLEGPLKGYLFQFPCNEQEHPQLHQMLRALTSPTLNVSRDGASTTSLGNLCQCLTTLTVKTFFFLSNLNFPSFNLKHFPLSSALASAGIKLFSSGCLI